MRTFWPTTKPTLTFGASTRIWRRMRFTSGGSSGTGRVPEPTKPVTPGRVAHDEPRAAGLDVVFLQLDHLREDVAGEDLARDRAALAVANLNLVLGRNHDLEDEVLCVHRLDAVLEVRLHLVLVAGVRVDNVPLAAFLDRRFFGRFGAAVLGASTAATWAVALPFRAISSAYLRSVWSTIQLNPMSMPPSTSPMTHGDDDDGDRQPGGLLARRPRDLPQLGDDVAEELGDEPVVQRAVLRGPPSLRGGLLLLYRARAPRGRPAPSRAASGRAVVGAGRGSWMSLPTALRDAAGGDGTGDRTCSAQADPGRSAGSCSWCTFALCTRCRRA